MAKRVAVIGGGTSGLACIKCCLDEGLEPVCFETSDDIGGLWRFKENPDPDRASIYHSLIINTSKEMMCFSDFPIPAHFPNYMHHSLIMDYFHMYADHFQLKRHIRFQTKVLHVTPRPDFPHSGQWDVETESKDGRREKQVFDAVMVCTGHHCHPHLPLQDFPDPDYSDYYNSEDTNFGSPCNDGSFGGVVLAVLYSTVFIVGLLGNAVVLCVLIRHRHRCSLTDMCLLSLAVSDLLFLASLPVWAHSAVQGWVLGSFMCHIITALFMMGLYSSVFFMVLMTLDRYVIIVYKHSICSRKWPSKMALSLFVWMLSLFASLPDIVFAKVKVDTSTKESCGSEFPEGAAWMSFTYLNTLSLILPLIIMSFCFCRILSSKSEEKHRIIRLLLAVLAVYFLFWTPYNIVTFLIFLQTEGFMLSREWSNDPSLAKQWMEAIALSHCCLNPIIYTCVGQKFRRAVLTVLKNPPQSPESASSEYSSTLIT